MHRSLPGQRASVVSASADETALPAAVARLARPLGRVHRAGVAGIEAAAFRLAALFPVASLPLLAALQYATLDPAVVLGLGAVNLLALVVSHRHDPGQDTDDATPRAADG